MPFDSNGIATVTRTIAVTGQTIQAAQVNVPFADIQNMLSSTMLRTGVGQATGNLNFGGFKAVNLADGANPNDAVTKQQLDAYLSKVNSFRNRLINGNFRVNQLAVTGTVTLLVDQYGHDCWKAGASGCTYTFSASGGITTINITAGSLINLIEGINVMTGTYVVSWVGTAQGRRTGGTYGASGFTTNVNGGGGAIGIEFNSGTLSLVQFEMGLTASPFENSIYETEELLCQRYYEKSYNMVNVPGANLGANVDAATVAFSISTSQFYNLMLSSFKVRKMVAPTIQTWAPNGVASTFYNVSSAINQGTIATTGISETGFRAFCSNTVLVANNTYAMYWAASARL